VQNNVLLQKNTDYIQPYVKHLFFSVQWMIAILYLPVIIRKCYVKYLFKALLIMY